MSVTRKERVCAADKEDMPPIGRTLHASQHGPRPPTRRRSGVAAITGTTIIAVLAVVVVVLSYQVATREPTVGAKDIAGLEVRLDALTRRVNTMRITVRTAARQAQASIAAAKRTPQSRAQPELAACLTQVQREIDDLQAYLAYRTPPRRDRVSGACLRLLQPRFKG